ncbi:hypothetical protein [uncultured Friedmanniella sp.]|uniref:hypothetical protein n=1 Tax=uncultured Friedmanniella sp. TaxID=335381 RepID=UPI0035CC0F14
MTDGRDEPKGRVGLAGLVGRDWRIVGVLAGVSVLLQGWGLYRVAGPPTPQWFPQADKLEHAAGFALPTVLVLLTLHVRSRAHGGQLSRRAIGWVVAAFGVHAVLSEIIQHVGYTTRTGDPVDVLADGTGTVVGALTAVALLRRSRVAGR